MKFLQGFIIILLIAVLFEIAAAGGNHHDRIVNTPVIETTEIYNQYETVITNTFANDKASNKGTAGAIATAQHQFNYGIYELQGSVAAGWYKSENAISFALGKRIDNVLYNGSILTDTDKLKVTGGGAAMNWTF